MKSVLLQASQLSQHACTAAVAIDAGDITTGYAHLLAAEHALRAAKREIQHHRPEAALNGVHIFGEFSTREQQARVESCVGHAIRGHKADITHDEVAYHAGGRADGAEDEVLASISCDRAVEPPPPPRQPRAPGRYALVDGRLLALGGTLSSPGRRTA